MGLVYIQIWGLYQYMFLYHWMNATKSKFTAFAKLVKKRKHNMILCY